ncbi:hypothetical protein [Methanoculleus sp.]|uniref:hypothetical protein n=1 Tax=Methanoculleus sp. TaxID=90427 RepID=UPI002FC63BE8
MKMETVLILALLTVAALLPGTAAGETPIECPFDEAHAEVYEQMLAENASVGEYYERVCPEFLESMPPETRAHLYNTALDGYHRDLASERVVFVPPEKQVAIGMASAGLGICGVPVLLYTVGILTLFSLVILALLAAVALVLERVLKKKE